MASITQAHVTEALNALKSQQLNEVCGQLERFIDKAGELFYDGDVPSWDTYTLAPQVVLENGFIPNGNLTPLGGELMGVRISMGLLQLQEKIARDFALGHELGHGISAKVLENIQMTGVSGTATEVVADLLSAFVWYRLGVNWTRLLGSLNKAQDSIFDHCKNGDHPAGKARIGFISTLFTKLSNSKDTTKFYQAVKEILRGL